jgi:methylmalonyl-CoA/ethylmalonyl-CoA epimerase
MDLRRITEVGVAVRDLEASAALLIDLLGAEIGPVVDVPLYDMRFRMCRIGKVDFEVMEPTAERGVIFDFLQRRGEGLHHIAFAVADLEAAMGELAAKRVTWIDPEPLRNHMPLVDYAGRRFDDAEIRFAFSHPKSILGILFEFIQYPAGYQTP